MISSCGDEAVGVEEGEKISDGGKFTPALEEAKFLNMARMESALDTLGRCLRLLRNENSCKASSLLERESLPWLDDVLWGEVKRIWSFVHGDCGTELARNWTSVGRLKALEWLLPCHKNLRISFLTAFRLLNFSYINVRSTRYFRRHFAQQSCERHLLLELGIWWELSWQHASAENGGCGACHESCFVDIVRVTRHAVCVVWALRQLYQFT